MKADAGLTGRMPGPVRGKPPLTAGYRGEVRRNSNQPYVVNQSGPYF